MPVKRPVFAPFAPAAETIRVTPEIARAGLLDWAADFKLGTAGYRDLLDPEDMHNPEVPFNSLNLAVMMCARAQLALEDGLADLHVGGEVRPHTQAFIDLAARIYAAAEVLDGAGATLPKSRLGKALKYVLGQRAPLEVFLKERTCRSTTMTPSATCTTWSLAARTG